MPSPDWSSIVHANVGIVTNAALRVLGSVQDAEDVTQDVGNTATDQQPSNNFQRW